ncbi:MAG TPA: hypothetical protein VF591_15380 [Pyrinomonadaceae bacterium]|jgi:hypothetical protein
MDSEAAREFKEGAGPGVLWACVLAGPVAALAQLQANYALVLWVCGTGRAWSLHAVSLAALAVAAGAGLLAWRNWRRAGAVWEDGGAGVLPRSRFMSAVGMFVSAHSVLVVVAQWLAVFFYGACQRA